MWKEDEVLRIEYSIECSRKLRLVNTITKVTSGLYGNSLEQFLRKMSCFAPDLTELDFAPTSHLTIAMKILHPENVFVFVCLIFSLEQEYVSHTQVDSVQAFRKTSNMSD